MPLVFESTFSGKRDYPPLVVDSHTLVIFIEHMDTLGFYPLGSVEWTPFHIYMNLTQLYALCTLYTALIFVSVHSFGIFAYTVYLV